MKRHLALALTLITMASSMMAQPKFASKAKKSMASVNTYDVRGNLLRQGSAFFIGKGGIAISDYKVFKDAFAATVTDGSGKQYKVNYIMGADDTYSMVKFSTDDKTAAPLTLAAGAEAIGSTMHIIGKDAAETASVRDTAMIQGKYVYYGLSKKIGEDFIGSPVFNEKGAMVGVVHANIGDRSYVLDARFNEALKIEAIPSSSASLALNNIHMPTAIPDNQEEALVYLYFKSKSASNKDYKDIVDRFIAAYPQCAEGYLRRATLSIDLKAFDDANADMHQYLSLVTDKVDGHYKVASLMYDKLRLMPVPAYDKWTYDTAIEHLNDAININATRGSEKEQASMDRACNLLKAQLLTSKGAYDDAIQLFEKLNEGEGKSPSIFYAISMARESRGDSIAEAIAPIDSALAMFGSPLPTEASKYIMRRGQLKAKAGNYRDAVADYNQYSYLLSQKVNDLFYYERSVVEGEGRMYQQALNDIDKAIEMAPRVADYHLQRAVVLVSVNMLEECVEACSKTIELNPDIVAAYRILGYAKYQLGDKEAGKQYLQKAIGMKDEWAKNVMETLTKEE